MFDECVLVKDCLCSFVACLLIVVCWVLFRICCGVWLLGCCSLIGFVVVDVGCELLVVCRWLLICGRWLSNGCWLSYVVAVGCLFF